MGNFLDGVAHHKGFGGTHHNESGTGNHKVIRVGIHLNAAHKFREPVKGNIGRKYGCGLSLHEYRNRVGGHNDISAALVKIWLRPITGARLQGLHEPLLGMVIVLLGCKGGLCDVVPVLERVRRHHLVYKGNGRSIYDGVSFHHP